MLKLIKKIFNKLLDPEGKKVKIKYINNCIKNGWIEIGENTSIENLNIDIREPLPNHLYIKLGNNCIIHGNLIIENSEGGILIDDNTYIGANTTLISTKKIIIGKNVMLAWGITVIDHNSHSLNYDERIKDMCRALNKEKVEWENVEKGEIVVEDYAWIGFNSIILKNVRISKGSIIGAGSVLTKSTEPFSVYGGNPARLIKFIQ
ncbi:MAG: acyltransferase [Raineya sp.]|jgi:galactoside O-acetyltransferase|nr:acyltransferase [Raineya sp.]